MKVIILFIFILLFNGCSPDLPPDKKALKIAQESSALGGNLSVKTTIHNWLSEKNDEIKPVGWKIEKKTEIIYIVGYYYQIHSFKEGIGEQAYFFEVNLDTKTVRNVTKELVKEMKPLEPAILDDKELAEKLLERSDGEQ